MRRGVISYSKVRAVTRVATPETEQTLLDVALAGTAAHVEQVVRAWRRVDRTAEAADDRRRHASRVLHTWVDDDGMVVIRGRLTPEVGAVVRRALEAALDEERRAAAAREPGEPDPVDEAVGVAPSFGQRQADALGNGGRMRPGRRPRPAARRATATRSWCMWTPARSQKMRTFPRERLRRCTLRLGIPTVAAGGRAQASACPGNPRAAVAQVSGTRPGGCRSDSPGQAALEEAGGIHVSAATAQRLACDAATVEMRHGPDGQVLDVGRKTRTISPALRRALASRDRQCRFPGCQARRCDAHHIRHWAHGGATALDNLVLLCRRP